MSRDGFLSRWARLKAEAAAAPPPEPAAPPAADPAQAAVPPPDPDTLSPEQVAALPPVDSVPDAEGLRTFLRAGVPAALRQAALRRMWTLNPVISTYVDPALDYAFDFNAPAAAIGWGPLGAGDDAQAMARRLFGEDRQPDAPAAEAAPAAARAEADAPTPADDAPPEAASAAEPPAAPPAAETAADTAEAAPPAPRRRHGGAAPA